MNDNRFFSNGSSEPEDNKKEEVTQVEEPAVNINLNNKRPDLGLPSLETLSQQAEYEQKKALDNPDEFLIRDFIGPNNEAILTKPFNIPAILGALYLFYRKLYLFGIILVVINALITILTPLPYLTLIFNVALVFTFNKLYLWHVNKKIDKIKDDNIGASKDQLASICTTKGGTSFKTVGIGIAISIGISAVVTLLALLIGISNPVTNVVGKYIHLNNKGFNGKISVAPATKELNYSFPNVFNKTSETTAELDAPIDAKAVGSTKCIMKINKVKNYSDATALAKEMASYYKVSLDTPIAINNIIWQSLTYTKNGDTYHEYLTDHNKKVYEYQFIVEKNANKTLCEFQIYTILNSVSFK
jgi:hypothetical protein